MSCNLIKQYFVFILVSTMLSNAYVTKTSQEECMHLDYAGREEDMDNQCSAVSVCRKSFQITYINMPPYVELFSIEDFMLRKCCGKCTNVTKVKYNPYLHHITDELAPKTNNSPDFVFPVLGKSTATKVHGYYFIPVIRAPNFIYLTRLAANAFVRSVVAIMNMWPLLVIMALVALVAGFVVWAMETWHNSDEFPRAFLIGWLQGIWWSSVTMASTGLERQPKSIIARFSSVIWVMISVIFLGLLTSSITAAMLTAAPVPTMKGFRIGSLEYHDYEKYLITKHGGLVERNPAKELQDEYYHLVKKFCQNEIHGILLDEYTLSYADKYLTKMVRKTNISFPTFYDCFMVGTSRTAKKADAEGMAFGILVKDEEVYKYFQDAVKENWMHYETIFASYVNNITEEERNAREEMTRNFEAPLFSTNDPHVKMAMAVFCGCLVVICLVGCTYELRRREKCCFAKATSHLYNDGRRAPRAQEKGLLELVET